MFTCKFIDIQEKDYNNHIKNNHTLTKQQLTIHVMDIWKRKRYNMHYHIIRKRVKKKPLAWALFVLKMMFKGLKKFMQFSLKSKNSNLSNNTQKGD